MNNKTFNIKKFVIILIGVILLTATAFISSYFKKENNTDIGQPLLKITAPAKLKADFRDSFSVDVTVSRLGGEAYPAASLSLGFDSSNLEFLGIEEGNVTVGSDSDSSLPEWSVNVERSNDIGQINILYLDVSGGRYAFSDDRISGEQNVLLRLKFRLRGSAAPGDIYELSVEDAVFAATDSEKSLASISGTLQTQNGRIILED